MQVEAGTVAYLRNGIPFYTSTVTPTYPLNADTSFDSAGGTLSDIVFANLVWADSGGVAISGASLRKSGGTAGWNAGAISTSVLASGDGFVEFTAIETDTTRMCGLAYGDSGLDDADIDFAIQLTSSGDVKVVESGTVRGTFGTYATGDRFRVEIQVGEVKYRKNGVVFYFESLAAELSAHRGRPHCYTDGATLSEVALGNFVWRSDVGVAVRAFGLVNTASTGWGLSGAVSTMELQSGDGYVEFTATDTASARMIGFNRGDANQSYTDLDFAIYPAGGTLFVLREWKLWRELRVIRVGRPHPCGNRGWCRQVQEERHPPLHELGHPAVSAPGGHGLLHRGGDDSGGDACRRARPASSVDAHVHPCRGHVFVGSVGCDRLCDGGCHDRSPPTGPSPR